MVVIMVFTKGVKAFRIVAKSSKKLKEVFFL